MLLSHRFRALVRHRYFLSTTLYDRTVSKLNAFPPWVARGNATKVANKANEATIERGKAEESTENHRRKEIVEQHGIRDRIRVNLSKYVNGAMSRRLILEYYDDAIRGYTCRMSLDS